MPIVSIDWTKIKSLYAGDTQFVALTDQHIAILSSLAEQLSWDKTWRTPDYDFGDKDTLDLEIADLQANLTMPVAITDIIGLIDDVETLLTEIRDLTQGQGGCCGDTAPLPNPYESPNADNYPGTPPATYGDGEPIADSDDWIELVCNAAHNYVDLLKATSNELDKLITTGALIIGGVAGILALLTSAGILSAIAYSAASSATSALLALTVKSIIGDSADDLEAARADIVCAIAHGSSADLAQAVEDAVDSSAWIAWYQWVDYDTAWNVMIDGGRDGEYLEAARRTDCDCTEQPLDDTGVYPIVPGGYGTDFSYLGGGLWTITSQKPAGCEVANVVFYSDPGYTTLLDVRLEQVSCTGAATRCAGVANYRGRHFPGPSTIYSIDHPTKFTPADGIVNDIYMVHQSPAFTVTFKIYSAT